MREARFIVPLGFGTSVAITKLKNQLAKLFHGFTEYNGRGVWQDKNGNLLHEEVQIIDVAYPQCYHHDCDLYVLAKEFRKNANQQEIYLRYGNGHVQLISEHTVAMDNGESMPTSDLEVPEYINLMDAVERFIDEHSTAGERVSALEYAIRSLTKGNKGHHGQQSRKPELAKA